MAATSSKVDRAIALFAEAHREDPRGLSELYHERLAHWVEELAGEPSVALLLAAHCQHIRRWTIPRNDFPEGLAGYKRWRSTLARFHADQADAVFDEVGLGADVKLRVRALLIKKGLKVDEEVQLFEDAICLVFVERELAAFATKHDSDKLIKILRKTWKKMSPKGHAAALAMTEGLSEELKALFDAALAPPAMGG